MERRERRQLAEDLCARMAATYGDDLLVGGVYGSTARGTDTEWSDLELLFVVKDGCRAKGQHFLYRDIAVGYRVYTESELVGIVTQPTTKWPFHMGVLSVLQALVGDPNRVQDWLRLGEAVPDSRFRQALEEALPELVWESHGRILSCRERGNSSDILPSVIEVLFEMQTALCLLNRRWVMHDYFAGFEDSLLFPKLPEGYAELFPALWSAREIEGIAPLAERLVESFKRLLREEGVEVKVYRDVEDIVL